VSLLNAPDKNEAERLLKLATEKYRDPLSQRSISSATRQRRARRSRRRMANRENLPQHRDRL